MIVAVTSSLALDDNQTSLTALTDPSSSLPMLAAQTDASVETSALS